VRLIYFSSTNMNGSEAGRRELEKRRNVLAGLASSGTTIEIVDNPGGPPSIQTLQDEFQAVPGTLANAARAEEEGFDGAIIGCFGDPGLHAVRERVRMPIVGSCQPAVHLAAQLGERFSVLSPVPSTVPFTRKLVEEYGLAHRLASVRPVGIPVLQIRQDRAGALERLIEVATRVLAEDEADTLVLGCMSMAYQGFAKDLSERLGVPVVNPLVAAVRTLEILVSAGLTQSPRIYKLGEAHC
jgi:allantoin racemase